MAKKKKKKLKVNSKVIRPKKPPNQYLAKHGGKRVVKHSVASWGTLKFQVRDKEITALSDLSITDSYNDDYNEKGKKIGRELTTFSVNVTYLAEMSGSFGGAKAAMQTWRSKLGKTAYFYVGGKKLFNRKCKLLGVNSGGMSFTNYGGMITVDLQLDFTWARTKEQEKAAKAEAKSSGTSSSKSKSTSSSKSSSGKSSGGSGSYSGGKMQWPLPGHKRISSNYGWRNCPYHGRELHSGIDIPAPNGTPIKAAAGGKVVLAGYNGSYGNCVIISHGKGIWTLYGHASSVTVKKGQEVKAGQTIAKVGSTGNSTGPHLHFEVRKGANAHKNSTSPWNYVSK